MKTTHQVARELLALPDVPLKVELWCGWDNPKAVMSQYDPEGTAFIVDESQERNEYSLRSAVFNSKTIGGDWSGSDQ